MSSDWVIIGALGVLGAIVWLLFRMVGTEAAEPRASNPPARRRKDRAARP